MSTQDDTHAFGNALTRADIRAAVNAVFDRRERRQRRSRENCAYVREQMRLREPRIAAAYDEAVRRA